MQSLFLDFFFAARSTQLPCAISALTSSMSNRAARFSGLNFGAIDWRCSLGWDPLRIREKRIEMHTQLNYKFILGFFLAGIKGNLRNRTRTFNIYAEMCPLLWIVSYSREWSSQLWDLAGFGIKKMWIVLRNVTIWMLFLLKFEKKRQKWNH